MTRQRHPSKAAPQDQHLNRVLKLYPQIQATVNQLLKGRGLDLPDWPQWCLLPMAGWDAINTPKRETLANISAIGTWAFSRGVYRFDPELASALLETALSDVMPSSVFYRIPEYCVFIEFPDGEYSGDKIAGYWAHLEWDVNNKRPELRLLLLAEDGLYPVAMHLGDWSVLTALRKASEQALINIKRDISLINEDNLKTIAREIAPLVSMLLYLCSDQPEIDVRREPRQTAYRQTEKRERRHEMLIAPRSILFDVGKGIGDKIRESRSAEISETGRKLRAHIRRAHWHGYWYGPRKGERTFGYRWIHPFMVGGDGGNRTRVSDN